MPKVKKIVKKSSKFKLDVQKALIKVRPALKAHGGNVRLVSVDEKKGIVRVRLQGMCVGCAMATITLEQGIGEFLKEEVKGFKKIEAA